MRPVRITIDVQDKVAYIYYCKDRKIASGSEVWKDDAIYADLDDEGSVIGIEVLGLDDELLTQARDLARGRGLEFPRDLAGAVLMH